MKKVLFSLAIVTLFFPDGIFAQTKSLEVETDPTSFFTGGYNFNLGYSFSNIAIRLTAVRAEVPKTVHGNEGFNQKMTGVAFNFDYFLKETANGFFLGTVTMYGNDEIANSHEEIKVTSKLALGVRTGFRLMPFRKQRENSDGFYLTPFISPVFVFANDVEYSQNELFEQKSFQLWGGIHLGWRFNLSN